MGGRCSEGSWVANCACICCICCCCICCCICCCVCRRVTSPLPFHHHIPPLFLDGLSIARMVSSNCAHPQ
jgi:hypothetical protein